AIPCPAGTQLNAANVNQLPPVTLGSTPLALGRTVPSLSGPAGFQFLANTAAYQTAVCCTNCTPANSNSGVVLRSQSAPDNSNSLAILAQKWLGNNSSTSTTTNTAISAQIYKTGNLIAGQSARALSAVTVDETGWTGGTLNFTEGARIEASCTSEVVFPAVCFAEGVVGIANNRRSNSNNTLIGFEGEVDTNIAPPGTLNPNVFAAGFLATSGSDNPAAQHYDTGFLITPNTPSNPTPREGFLYPAGNNPAGSSSVTFACFRNDSSTVYTLDAHLSTPGTSHIWLPNNSFVLM